MQKTIRTFEHSTLVCSSGSLLFTKCSQYIQNKVDLPNSATERYQDDPYSRTGYKDGKNRFKVKTFLAALHDVVSQGAYMLYDLCEQPTPEHNLRVINDRLRAQGSQSLRAHRRNEVLVIEVEMCEEC